MNNKQEETKTSKIINIVLKGALVAAALSFVPAYAGEADVSKTLRPGQHCIYDAVPLEGAWEMSYCSNAWDSVACPKFKGVAVAKAVPGFWENMVPALRAAGMKDAFRINPAYERQTLPMTQWAKCTRIAQLRPARRIRGDHPLREKASVRRRVLHRQRDVDRRKGGEVS